MTLPDIPRAYTALAEWMACMVYLLPMQRRLEGWKLWVVLGVALPVQGAFLVLTGDLPIGFWIPCMIAAVGLMLLSIWLVGQTSLPEACYTCVRAFVLAELAAALEWQLHCFLWPGGEMSVKGLLLLATVYGGIFSLMVWLERFHAPVAGHMEVAWREVALAAIIGVAVFTFSNLSFVTPFGDGYGLAIFNTRTLADLGGVAILFAYHLQRCELRYRRELEAMESVLQNQYQQYQWSKESIDLINRKYHDLKHQIAALRAAHDAAQRDAYLDQMEADIKSYEAQNKTGHPVLDTILTSKSIQCQQEGISLSCVADGSLLGFMDVMDICTVFGNALDNAI